MPDPDDFFRYQILLQWISDGTITVIYHFFTLGKSEEKCSLIQFHVLPSNLNGLRPLKIILKNNFLRYLHELCTKGKFILRRKEDLVNFRITEKVDVMDFWLQKSHFRRGKLVER